MSAWTECPPDHGPSRDAWTLKQIEDGNFNFNLVPLEVTAGGRTAVFLVTSDALTIEGIRVPVNAKTQQTIADMIQCSMLTPKLSDQMHVQRSVTILPPTRPITSKTSESIAQSERIDGLIAKAGGNPDGGIVSSDLKDWVLCNALASRPGKAANYGFYVPGVDAARKWGGIKCEASVSVPGLWLIQGVGTVHDTSHTDYSQLARFVAKNVIVDGEETDIETVMTDPSLAALVNHDGVLKVTRQPGSQVVSPIIDNPGRFVLDPPTAAPAAASSSSVGPTIAKATLVGALTYGLYKLLG